MIYQFETTATMKPHNKKKWWIDSGIIRKITVEADSLAQALKQYRKTVYERDYIEISKNALKNKAPMYRDDKEGFSYQCGYVITAKTDFNNDYRGWVTQYIDLWVTVNIITNPFTEAQR